MASVLIVDDDDSIRSVFEEMLRCLGFDVFSTPDVAQTVQIMESLAPDMMMVDLMMPINDGVELIKNIRKSDTIIPIIVVSGTEDQDLLNQAQEVGANIVLRKPLVLDILISSVRQLLPQFQIKPVDAQL